MKSPTKLRSGNWTGLPRLRAAASSPTTEQIRKARDEAGHTQAQAGETIHVARRTWQDYERGERTMPPGLYELYRIKTGLADP